MYECGVKLCPEEFSNIPRAPLNPKIARNDHLRAIRQVRPKPTKWHTPVNRRHEGRLDFHGQPCRRLKKHQKEQEE